MPRLVTPSSVPGVYTDPSAVLPFSGTMSPSHLSGPWAVEEQDMTITYMRMPHYGVCSTSFGLTQPTCLYRTANTYMSVFVAATYSKKKTYDWYSTSSFQQTQKFDYSPIATDGYGISYGDVGASGLGPNGTVTTLRPWYSRRDWDSTIDTEAVSACKGTRHYFKKDGQTAATSTNVFLDGLAPGHWGQHQTAAPTSDYQNSFQADNMFGIRGDNVLYQLAGSFSTAQENPLLIQSFVDDCGKNVTNIEYYGIPIVFTSTPSVNPSILYYTPKHTQGFPQYNVTYHDWT